MRFVGIDLGASTVHVVVLDVLGAPTETAVLSVSSEMDALREICAGATQIAIDAPSAPTSGAHVGDTTVAAKFRSGRCAEVALGLEHKIWVPWVTPAREAMPGWMLAGISVFDALRADGHRPVETFPHAAFRMLAGGRLPSKKTAAGVRARAEALRAAGTDAPGLEMWSHDALDACVAAVVARGVERGTSLAVGCGHDGSAIWIPMRQPA